MKRLLPLMFVLIMGTGTLLTLTPQPAIAGLVGDVMRLSLPHAWPLQLLWLPSGVHDTI